MSRVVEAVHGKVVANTLEIRPDNREDVLVLLECFTSGRGCAAGG